MRSKSDGLSVISTRKASETRLRACETVARLIASAGASVRAWVFSAIQDILNAAAQGRESGWPVLQCEGEASIQEPGVRTAGRRLVFRLLFHAGRAVLGRSEERRVGKECR